MGNSRRSVVWGSALLASLAIGACGKGDSGGGGTGAGGVKTGPGITDKTISLGVLTDLSGPFAPLAGAITNGNKMFWDARNAKGGVCGRKVKLVVKDHGYDTQKAVVQYRAISPDVAAIQQLVGSPMTAALLPKLKTDSMLSMLASWPSSLLSSDFVIEVGAPYELEMINGLGYLYQKGLIKDGDKLGDLYFEGEYGEAGLAGVKSFAAKHHMTVVEQKIQPTDEDMTGQTAAFKRAGVDAIAVTTSPTAFASLAALAGSQGFDVPILGNNPTYDPALLDTPAADALQRNAYVASSVAPIADNAPAVAKVAKRYAKDYPKETPKNAVVFGYSGGQVMYDMLKKACSDHDLSREGIVTASRELSGIATHGLSATKLNYTKVGEPSGRGVYVARPAKVVGGLKPVGGVTETAEAKAFKTAS